MTADCRPLIWPLTFGTSIYWFWIGTTSNHHADRPRNAWTRTLFAIEGRPRRPATVDYLLLE
uniref:Uncharacterized protein n=1 Tax=Meloidogyne incognita TaxID=6306 RepID=A0A914NJA8_MELIC